MDQVPDDRSGEPNLYQPGQSISPTAGAAADNTPPNAVPQPTVEPTPLQQPPAQSEMAKPPTPPEETSDNAAQPALEPPVQPSWPAQAPEPAYPSVHDMGRDNGAITWTASEFIDHQKTSGWYLGVGAAAVFGAALVWLVTRDFFPATAVCMGLVLLGVYGARKPHEESYMLDESGLTIGNRHYPYDDFRSFTVLPEGAFLGIELTPLKRFAMYVTVYCDPADEDKILDRLSTHLPMTEPRSNLTDSLMRRIHF